MDFSRRRFLGGSFAAAAGLFAPGTLAQPSVPAAARLADRPPLLAQALEALDRHSAQLVDRDRLAIADFSSHSKDLRFHIVDLAGANVMGSYLVAHGRGSDPANSGFVERFSNRPGSNASSQGAFLTGEVYRGKHGRSRRLHGLDEQNDLAFQRAIVIHGASYVDMNMARRQGRSGRSQGCFSVERCKIDEVLEWLGPGRLLFASK